MAYTGSFLTADKTEKMWGINIGFNIVMFTEEEITAAAKSLRSALTSVWYKVFVFCGGDFLLFQ